MDTVQIIGIGIAVFTISRALLQIPIALVADKLKSGTDEIVFLIIGNLLMGLPYLFIPFISTELQYYLIQAVFGTGSAINLISWRKLFALNLDKDREAIEYAVYDTILSVSTALFSTVAGIIANISDFYFDIVMLTIGIIMSSSWIWGVLILIHKKNESITKQSKNSDWNRSSKD
jgi:MFS family permease